MESPFQYYCVNVVKNITMDQMSRHASFELRYKAETRTLFFSPSSQKHVRRWTGCA